MMTWSQPPTGSTGLEAQTSSPLVVGLGNVLLGDDGFGPAVCEELSRRQSEGGRRELPPETRLIDGGTLGTALVPWLLDARAVVIVDAIDLPGTPGSVLVWRSPSLAGVRADGGSGLADLLAMRVLAGMRSDGLSLVGVIAADIGPRMGLSTAVSAAVPRAASMVAREIRKLTGGIG